MGYLKYIFGLAVTSFMFSGCTGQPSIAEIDETEAFKYIKQYDAEYQQLKANSPKAEMQVKWVQAANKKEPCKLFVSGDSNDDRTSKDGYKIFWDGNCKNGYASGLGREFERGFLTNLDAIALYNGEEKKPEYFIQKDNLANITMEGDIINGNLVQTTIVDDGMNFDIKYQYGHFQRETLDTMFSIISSPFSSSIVYIKSPGNYAYIIGDVTNDEFNENNYNYDIKDGRTKQSNGFVFSVAKNNIRYCGEKINNQLVRRVNLPQSYINHMVSTFNEIKNIGQIAIDAQKKALMVKQQYKDTICKDTVKVDFIDNKEYKAICNENEKIAQLRTKIDAKLSQIEQQKQAKRQQQNDQRLIQAREAEAMAAQRRASAAEQANNQRALDSFNQSMQNLNNNMQMQQLNNNLMMNNMMPKRYDVYVH